MKRDDRASGPQFTGLTGPLVAQCTGCKAHAHQDSVELGTRCNHGCRNRPGTGLWHPAWRRVCPAGHMTTTEYGFVAVLCAHKLRDGTLCAQKLKPYCAPQ